MNYNISNFKNNYFVIVLAIVWIFFNNFRNFKNIDFVILFYSGIKNVLSNQIVKKIIIYINFLKITKTNIRLLKF